MARLAYYAGVQPSEFEEMDYLDSVELANRCQEFHQEDQKLLVELAKFQARAAGAKIN